MEGRLAILMVTFISSVDCAGNSAVKREIFDHIIYKIKCFLITITYLISADGGPSYHVRFIILPTTNTII